MTPKRFIRLLIVFVTAILLFFNNPFMLNASVDKAEWQGKDRFGNLLTENDIKSKLKNYYSQFSVISKNSNIKFLIVYIDLEKATLNELNLSRLVEEVNIEMSIKWDIGINLKGANLRKANLSSLRFWNSDFSNAEAAFCDLSQTVLFNSKFDNAVFSACNFKEANLSACSFNNSTFTQANMEGATILSMDSKKVGFGGVNFKNAKISGKFENSDFNNANAEGATIGFPDLDLSFSKLVNTNLSGAKMNGNINLSNVQYEVISTPSVDYLREIIIKDIWFESGRQVGLIRLKEAFKTAGLRNIERELNYYIEKGNTNYSPFFERYFKRLFFEYTCGYGLNYFRPILIILILIIINTFIYYWPISGVCKDGIYKKFPEEQIGNKKKRPNIQRLTKKRFGAIAYSLYFSLLSAFHFGWRDFNVGYWITRMQKEDYTLIATSWVRVVSGVQSLLSVYLFALWALAYFGRPFG